MANLSLELFTTGFSQIQVKGKNMNHLVTAYHRKYVHLITFNIISPTAPLGQNAIWQAVVNLFSIQFIQNCNLPTHMV